MRKELLSSLLCKYRNKALAELINLCKDTQIENDSTWLRYNSEPKHTHFLFYNHVSWRFQDILVKNLALLWATWRAPPHQPLGPTKQHCNLRIKEDNVRASQRDVSPKINSVSPLHSGERLLRQSWLCKHPFPSHGSHWRAPESSKSVGKWQPHLWFWIFETITTPTSKVVLRIKLINVCAPNSAIIIIIEPATPDWHPLSNHSLITCLLSSHITISLPWKHSHFQVSISPENLAAGWQTSVTKISPGILYFLYLKKKKKSSLFFT